MTDKTHIIISIDSEKALDNIQHALRIKTLNKLSIECMYVNIIKSKHEKPTANIMHNGEKLKKILLRLGTTQE